MNPVNGFNYDALTGSATTAGRLRAGVSSPAERQSLSAGQEFIPANIRRDGGYSPEEETPPLYGEASAGSGVRKGRFVDVQV